MLPPRPSGGHAAAQGPKSGIISSSVTQSFEAIKMRVLAKLEDRMDPSTSKRMPVSLLRQSLRTYAEQIAEQEGRNLPKPDRERLVDEVLAELLGYGPLEELFSDQAVREVMIIGPHVVLVRRESGGWIPSNVRFRDDEHLGASLDRLATHADPVGGITTSVNTFDLKLPNGFRAVAVLPPPGLDKPAHVVFIRVESSTSSAAAAAVTGTSATKPAPVGSGSSSNLPRTAPTGNPSGSGTVPGARPPSASDSPATSPRPSSVVNNAAPRGGSSVINTPPPRNTEQTSDALMKHRNRIIERLISKLASLGVYDLHRVEITEMRKVIAAYVAEYVVAEKIYLSDADQSRLILEILTAMQR
jgi:hypothetical protein